jgi:TPR repeat protein
LLGLAEILLPESQSDKRHYVFRMFTMAHAKDDREAARLFRLAADQGDASAQNSLGIFYATGRGGLPQDDREAAHLFKLSAYKGNAFGQHSLGIFYSTGRGRLSKDDREATRLFKLAANQGNADGQVSLGVMYQYGRGGLSKDEGEAARLFKLAADQGDASAQLSLGNLAQTQIDDLYAADQPVVPKKRWARWLLRWLVPRKVRREFNNVFKFAQADEKENIIARFQQRHGCGRARAMRLAVEVEQELRRTKTWR